MSEWQVQKENVNGVSVSVLEEEMKKIKWETACDLDAVKAITLDDKKTWEEETQIELVVMRLDVLEKTAEGKQVAALLKQKYWSGFVPLVMMINQVTVKAKSDIHQRFYLQEGQGLISVEEAYRFLQNKKLEKQVQANKRQSNNVEPDNEASEQGITVAKHGRGKTGKQKGGGKSYRSKAKA